MSRLHDAHPPMPTAEAPRHDTAAAPAPGPGGDLPPRPECTTTWRRPLLAQLTRLELVVLVGRHAHLWHLPDSAPAV